MCEFLNISLIKKLKSFFVFKINKSTKNNTNINPKITITNFNFNLQSPEMQNLANSVQKGEGEQPSFSEEKRKDNVQHIVIGADKEIISNRKNSTDIIERNELDCSWCSRFLECCKDVSNEEVQEMFSKILAREATKPNSISLKTLDILKNLSPEDAKIFKKISNIVIHNCIFYNDKISQNFLSIEAMMQMIECGLLNPSENKTAQGLLKFKRTDSKGNNYIPIGEYQGNVLLYRKHEKVVNIPIMKLSNSGFEIFQTLKPQRDSKYLSYLSKFLKTQEATLMEAPSTGKEYDLNQLKYVE